ncbi:MAG: glycosyltransferase family 1 protein [Chloroflexota bacterium]
MTLFRDLPTERWWSMERYADELTRALRAIGCDTRAYVAARPLPQLPGALNTFANYAWRSTIYPLAARAHQGDVNHILDHSYAHLIHALDPARTVVTCHDLAPLALNEGRGFARRLWDHSFRAMLRAVRIITDSEFTRDEILRHSNYPAEQITVAPLAVGAEFFEPVALADLQALRARHRLSDRRIILHVGSCAPRKNIAALLVALARLRELEWAFVQVGGQFDAAQDELIDQFDLRDRVRQIPRAPENQLRAWYHTAAVFVLPSTYEGFGLPILEAMAAGAPVVCADASALPEVAHDTAILIDPRDPAKLADALRSILTDARLADDLRARGIARAQSFTWERTARATLAVYQEIKR